MVEFELNNNKVKEKALEFAIVTNHDREQTKHLTYYSAGNEKTGLKKCYGNTK